MTGILARCPGKIDNLSKGIYQEHKIHVLSNKYITIISYCLSVFAAIKVNNSQYFHGKILLVTYNFELQKMFMKQINILLW